MLADRHFIDVDEASARYGLARSWFYERTRTKAIPHIRCGKYVRFDPDVLDAWFAAAGGCELDSEGSIT